MASLGNEKTVAKDEKTTVAAKAVAAKKAPVKEEKKAPVAKEPAKKETVKAEPVKKETVKKETAKPAAKAETKTEKKAPAKKPGRPAGSKNKKKQPVERTQEVYFEFEGNQILSKDIVAKVEEAYKAEGHRIGAIKTLQIYINPYENRAYYVINGKEEGKYVECVD